MRTRQTSRLKPYPPAWLAARHLNRKGIKNRTRLIGTDDPARIAPAWLMVMENKGLIYQCAYYYSRQTGYPMEDLLSSVAMGALRAAVFQDDSRSQYSTFVFFIARQFIETFLVAESEAARQQARSESVRMFDQGSAAFHENEFYAYRIPEPDDAFIAAIFELFDNSPARLWEALTSGLVPGRKRVVEMYYRDGMTMQAIADSKGCSKQNVQQMVGGALDTIKRKLHTLTEFAKLFEAFEIDE